MFTIRTANSSLQNNGNNNRLESDEDTSDVGEQEQEIVCEHDNIVPVDCDLDRYTYRDIKKNDVIKYKLPDSEWESVKVLSRAAKANGKNKYWWNVQVLETGNSKSVNTENFEELEKVLDQEEEDVEETLVVLIPHHLH